MILENKIAWVSSGLWRSQRHNLELGCFLESDLKLQNQVKQNVDGNMDRTEGKEIMF